METNLNSQINLKSKFDYPNHFAGESANGTGAGSSNGLDRSNVTQSSKVILAIGRKTQFDVRSAALIGQGLF